MEEALLNAHYTMAVAEVQQKRLDKAREKIDFVIAECMKDASAHIEILYKAYKLKLDLASENKKDRENVAVTMLDVLGKNVEYRAKVLHDLAQLHKIDGEHQKYIDILLQLKGEFPESDFELGQAYLALKDVKNASKHFLAYLNKIGKNHSNIVIVVSNLASCYNALGKPEEAKAILKRYLNIK